MTIIVILRTLTLTLTLSLTLTLTLALTLQEERKGIRVCHIVVRVILFFFPFFGAILMVLPNLMIVCACPYASKSLIG